MADLSRRRRLVTREVVQTSAMDCGPAVLKCLLAGYGIHVNYGRLREACQTDVDGTSIDVLEQLACRFGLAAEQIMLPIDHLSLDESQALPAIVVVRQPAGLTHFVLVWRRHGRWMQVMDPAVGRRWISCRSFLDEVYLHRHRVPATDWREWATSDENRRALTRRLANLGIARSRREEIFDRAAGASCWRPLATLDAATRLTAALVDAGGLRCGGEAERVLLSVGERAAGDDESARAVIPAAYWSVSAAPALDDAQDGFDGPMAPPALLMRGAVLVRILGRVRTSATQGKNSENAAEPAETSSPLPESRDLAAAMAAPEVRPISQLWALLGESSAPTIALLLLCLMLAAACATFEALLLRGAIDISRDLGPTEQRLQAMGIFEAFAAAALLIELVVAWGLNGLGRRLEVQLRVAFLRKIPRLVDAYFQSRPISDMGERGHVIHQIRVLPMLAGRWMRASLTLLLVAAALGWLDPAHAWVAAAASLSAIALPLAFNPVLQGLDLRVRTHAGALSHFYLDALLGMAAVRAHGAERVIRRGHEDLLVQWAKANGRLLRWVVVVEGMQITVGFALAARLVFDYAGEGAAVGGLMLAYWALQIPVLGADVAQLARRYPVHRNLALRLLEPIGAPEDPIDVAAAPRSLEQGVAIRLESVTMRAAGQTILRDVDLDMAPGSRVAIVGPSGAGKSSLVGMLLGWRRPASGRILVDRQPLDATRQDQLRRETAWVDPSVQLWNQSLLSNLVYGAEPEGPTPLAQVLDAAELYSVVQRLPAGLQTSLGEEGGLVSGGEGQRVRLGRAMSRAQTRLVLLDEPFRGLDREMRGALLRQALQLWSGATFVCVTHDVGDTLGFDCVLVVEGGQVVEQGPPAELQRDAQSRYSQMLAAEHTVRTRLWSDGIWRRLRLESGRLTESPASPAEGDACGASPGVMANTDATP